MSHAEARKMAQKFVVSHKSKITGANQKQIESAIERIARALTGVRRASDKAQRNPTRPLARAVSICDR